MCQGRQRELERTSTESQTAFQLYVRFYKKNFRKTVSWEHFAKSRHYNEFIKAAKAIISLNPVNTPQYMDFLCSSELPITQWTSSDVYQAYLTDLLFRETPDAAIERTVRLMVKWGEDNNRPWTEFFREVNANQAIQWIITGRLTGWSFFACESADQLVSRMTDEQTMITYKYIHPDMWSGRLKKYAKELSAIKQVMIESGI